ncbi:PadR family transcriptional regulator, regulatory protein PadR [Amycolatopsis arida]|uniref:PadR family transcriptional regulator, regulatory protein PadR n=1 Tax=Amycolatopsis arida TaxID=587909 RepID=A0A1I5KCG9_9PSEU|nr:PadR family transcriptional regulator [Amycolatopsis arida]TDX96986.1 PadR family transcriptional regulator PadR [Amycolatopsis arida]SFO82754.1 PadR family transcriptional regulator, regulatory protein PadR [Amycolatopsis arida]
MRTTHALVQVAIAIMASPDAKHWGYDLSKESGVRSGVLYPILRRMLEEGWLVDGWESAEDIGKRPPRRYYTLTEKGQQEIGAILHAAKHDARFRGLSWRLA